MAIRRTAPKRDERDALRRYVDQPGQRIDTTPAGLKAQQAKAMQQLRASLKTSKRKASK